MSKPTTTTTAHIKADVDPRDRAKPRSFRLADGSIATMQFTSNGGALLRMKGGRTVALSPAMLRNL